MALPFSPVHMLLGFVVSITVIVFVHEMGHFLVGRWCGVKVDAFSIGFGPELAAWVDRKGTRWRIGALPLGGYVKFHGDLNAASVADAAAVAHMPAAERAVSFPAQPIWKRSAIVAAGPIANFVLAFVIATGMIYASGVPSRVARIGAISPGTPAAAAGFAVGDVVTAIDGRPVDTFEALRDVVARSPGRALIFSVKRGADDIQLSAVPSTASAPDRKDGQGAASPTGQLGVRAAIQPVSLLEAVGDGAVTCWAPVAETGHYLGKLFTGKASPDQLSGPIGIAVVAGQAAQLGPAFVLQLIALLSISIGLTNLLPIPLLDGGHLLFYACEAVRGRPLSPRVQEVSSGVGLAFIVVLMVLVTKNDLVQQVFAHLG